MVAAGLVMDAVQVWKHEPPVVCWCCRCVGVVSVVGMLVLLVCWCCLCVCVVGVWVLLVLLVCW